MTISVQQQAQAVVQAVCLGLLVGLLYDLMRIMRVRLKLPFLGAILDFLFWVAVTAVLFLWSQDAWGGEIRLYGVLFLFLGGTLYFKGLSVWMLKIGYLGADFLALIWKIFTYPITCLKNTGKKMKKIAKKTFHSGVKWYKINQITGELATAERRRSARETGGNDHAVQAYWMDDQGAYHNPDDLHDHLVAESAWADPIRSKRAGRSAGAGRRAKTGKSAAGGGHRKQR